MSDESLEKHIQLDAREEFGNYRKSSGDGRGDGSGGGDSPFAPKPIGPIKIFYRDLVMVLTEPRTFFESRYPQTSFTYALTFGIIVTWIAAFLSWLTRVVRHETLFDGLIKMREKLQELPFWKSVPENFWAQTSPDAGHMVPAWLAEMFGIVLAPFQALISLTIYGIVIFVGCYLLVPKTTDRDSVEVKNTIKLVAFASAPQLISAVLGFLPIGLGPFIGAIYGFVLLVFALSIRYRVSGLRAFGIVILPGFVTLIAFGCLIGVFAGVLFGLFASLFGSMS